MRKQFLWLDKAGYYFNGPGNISIGEGAKGSAFFWFHPAVAADYGVTVWEANVNQNNCLRLWYSGGGRLCFLALSGGQWYEVQWTDFFFTHQYQQWLPVTCTWDFTVPGAGKLRLYVDGQEAPARVDNAPAPLGECQRLYLGPKPADPCGGLDGFIDNFTVWNGVMTLEQHQALRGAATEFGERQNARRRRPLSGDCDGMMTLLAGFDGQYDAEIAGGDGTAQWLVTPEAYSNFARIDDGSRSRGERCRFLFGMPRHDNSEEDRVPLRAVLPILRAGGVDQHTTVVDKPGHSEVNVSALVPVAGCGQGVNWLQTAIDPNPVAMPSTIKMRVAVPDATNPVKTRIALGPLIYINGGMHGSNFGTWGTGESFTVVADAANTASSFKTTLSGHSDGYWNGAEVSVYTGACANTRLKVTWYDADTGVVTVAGALPVVPAAGDFGNADFRGRLIPMGQPPIETQSMDAWLWEQYASDRPWTEIECVYGSFQGGGYTRYQRGRTTYMELMRQKGSLEGQTLMFGRAGVDALPESFECNILIESLIIEGPGSYQEMPAEDTRLARGFEAADTFMIRDLGTGHSSRLWRWENCAWAVDRPTMNANPQQAAADLGAAGTWRHTAQFLATINEQMTPDEVVALVRGTDQSGVQRMGYVRGTWDEATRRIRWEDEVAPEGASNPFLEAAELRPWFTNDSKWGLDGMSGGQVLKTPDGTWSLLYTGTEGNPDHYFTRALHGAQDRWSFDPDRHWWPENPMLPGIGGVDATGPDFGGFNLFGNRDAAWVVASNPYARDKRRRFIGYSRFKTLLPLQRSTGTDRRPIAGWSSPDLKSFFLLPHGNQLTPLPIGEAFQPVPYAISDDVIGLVTEFYGGKQRLLASDDDRHFQEICWDYMDDACPFDSFRLGDKRIYFFWNGQSQNFAYTGYNRETHYELKTGATGGMVETPVVRKPVEGWGTLILNVDPGPGTVRVEVVNAETEEALRGFGAEDCDALAEGLEKRVTWKTLELSEVTAEAIRLRFWLSRTTAGTVSPKLFRWQIGAPPQQLRPSVEDLTVDGRVAPAGLVDALPKLGWQYQDVTGAPQAACQVLVASSEEKLAANVGDLWDTGVVVGSAHDIQYAGAALDDQTTYFWKVRVQNTEGVWSEEW